MALETFSLKSELIWKIGEVLIHLFIFFGIDDNESGKTELSESNEKLNHVS